MAGSLAYLSSDAASLSRQGLSIMRSVSIISVGKQCAEPLLVELIIHLNSLRRIVFK